MAAKELAKGSASIIPMRYILELIPNMNEEKFSGTVSIHLNVLERTTCLKLNAIDLSLQTISIETWGGSGRGEYQSAAVPRVEEDNIFLELEHPIPAGSKAIVHLAFDGICMDNMMGLYRSTYTDDSGLEHILVVTNMEPNYARRVFPCFDEPSLKAEFSISVIADEDMTCLSNMSVSHESKLDSSDKKRVTFETTPRMSTYLVALVVGHLGVIRSEESRIPISVYAPLGLENDGRYALELALKGLKFYERVFKIPYPLPKLDLVAVPDFSAGAMENWGLIIFRMVELLITEGGLRARKRTAETVMHELSHQWFGNLVTMDSWEGLWLNEGFATWMSWFASDHFHLQWAIWQDYVADTLQQALKLDSLRSSHPVQVSVSQPDEVGQIFDDISYRKGSSVLRMISKQLGQDVFLEGVRLYLERHQYQNTSTDDLWRALSDSSGNDLAETMNIWTKYVGYPVVQVTEKQCNPEHGSDGTLHILLEQRRFLSAGKATPEEDCTTYPLQVTIFTNSGVETHEMTEKKIDPETQPGQFLQA